MVILMKMLRSTRVLPAVLIGTAIAAGLTAAERARRSGRRRACQAPDSAPARTSSVQSVFGGYVVTGRTVTINRSPRTVYDFWRQFENLAAVMDNVEAVRTAGRLTEWQIRAPFGKEVTISTEIVEDRPDRLISWRSTAGSVIETRGKVLFHEAPGGRGTIVELIIAYKPPGGRLGRALARVTGREPGVQARHELRRLKMLLETGEIADSRNTISQKDF